MSREEFIAYLESTYKVCVDIVKKKNHDYSKDADPFSNFRAISAITNRPPEEAIMTFIANKLSRASNLFSRENAVKSESVEDTLIDAINYLAILRAYLYAERRSTEH